MNTNLTSYKNSLFKAMIMTGFIMLTFIGAECRAAVYVCESEACNKWNPITQVQSSYQATIDAKIKPTVDQALQGSVNDSITNGYHSVANTNLYISKFWHKGGNLPFDTTYEHLTVQVWKDDYWVKTCHVYSFQVNEKYKTSCVAIR